MQSLANSHRQFGEGEWPVPEPPESVDWTPVTTASQLPRAASAPTALEVQHGIGVNNFKKWHLNLMGFPIVDWSNRYSISYVWYNTSNLKKLDLNGKTV